MYSSIRTSSFAARVGILLLVCLIAGCDRGNPADVLRFSHFWSEPAQRTLMDSLVSGFRREHPEIPVEVSELSWSDGKTKLMIGFNAETAPDVIELGSDWIAQFSSSGVLLDLDSDATSLDRLALSPDYAREPGRWNGKYFAVPWLLDTRVMFVNDALVRGSGETSRQPLLINWDAASSLAAHITSSGKGKGIGVNGSDDHRLYKKILPMIWSFGGDLFDKQGHPTFTRAGNVMALQYYVDQQSHGVLESQKNLDDMFKRGELGIWYSGSWMLKPLAKATFPWHTELVPGNGGVAGSSFAGGEYLAINKKTEMRKEALLFLEYVTRRQNELMFARGVNMYPADTIAQLDTFFLHRSQGAVFTEQMKHARMTPVLPQWLDIEAILEDEVSRAIYKKATPLAALQSAQTRVEELLKEP